jgi:arylsulfatase A-like enzyme
MGKQNLYEHSIRVPLVFAGPGVPQGRQSDALVYLLDIYPTLFDLLDLDPPNSVEGLSLVPAMNEPSAQIRETLYLAYKDYQRGIRDASHKLIEYHVNGRRTTQLFDLAADPWENHSLADEPAVQSRLEYMRSELFHHRDQSGDLETKWGNAFWDGFYFAR